MGVLSMCVCCLCVYVVCVCVCYVCYVCVLHSEGLCGPNTEQRLTWSILLQTASPDSYSASVETLKY